MSTYQSLNIDQSKLDEVIDSFLNENNLKILDTTKTPDKIRVNFGETGEQNALFEIFLKNDGTTTLHFKIGKNQHLGEKLACYIKSKLCIDLQSLNMVIQSISKDDIQLILDEISTNSKITITSKQDDIYVLTSEYKDSLTLAYHPTSNKLQIQGRPLFCYNNLAYILSAIMGAESLAKILYKKDDFDQNIAREEIATLLLKKCLPKSYDLLPTNISKMLVSGQCIKASSPELTDYSLLTYSELRALEGIIKNELVMNEVDVSDLPSSETYSLGGFFEKDGNVFKMKDNIAQDFTGTNKEAVEKAFTFYRLRRHSLFHAEFFDTSTTLISSLSEAINICEKVYTLIENIYE